MATDFERQLETLRRNMREARSELLRTVEAVPPGLFQVAPRGEWSIAAILAHVVGSEHFYATGIDTLRERAAGPAPAATQPPTGPEDAVGALAASRERLLAAVEAVTEDEFYRMRRIGYNEESVRSILENVAMHDREHAEQLRKTVAEAGGDSGFRIGHIDHVALTVADVQRSVAWYQEVLGLERRFEEAWGDHPAVVCAGETCLALFPATTAGDVKPSPGTDTIAMRHFAFAVDRANFQRAQERLRELGIEPRFADHGISHSVYLKDPDGHEIEITTYEI